jgi:hypothetical protein
MELRTWIERAHSAADDREFQREVRVLRHKYEESVSLAVLILIRLCTEVRGLEEERVRRTLEQRVEWLASNLVGLYRRHRTHLTSFTLVALCAMAAHCWHPVMRRVLREVVTSEDDGDDGVACRLMGETSEQLAQSRGFVNIFVQALTYRNYLSVDDVMECVKLLLHAGARPVLDLECLERVCCRYPKVLEHLLCSGMDVASTAIFTSALDWAREATMESWWKHAASVQEHVDSRWEVVRILQKHHLQPARVVVEADVDGGRNQIPLAVYAYLGWGGGMWMQEQYRRAIDKMLHTQYLDGLDDGVWCAQRFDAYLRAGKPNTYGNTLRRLLALVPDLNLAADFLGKSVVQLADMYGDHATTEMIRAHVAENHLEGSCR